YFSSRRRHTRFSRDWSSDVCSSDLAEYGVTYSISSKFANDIDLLASMSLRDTGIFYDADGDVVGADNTQGDVMDSRTVNGFVKRSEERRVGTECRYLSLR